jgi:DTW domain-containing protein
VEHERGGERPSKRAGDLSLAPSFEPRAACARCERPVSVCWCAHLPALEAETPVLILQHPREDGMPIGTARMATLCLRDAELLVGVELDEHPRLRAVFDDPVRKPILLWPGPDAKDLELEPPSGPTTLVVVDGTWALAKKLVRVNPRLAALPRYALEPPAPSGYRIRREPRAECVSTIEAVMYALGALERDPERFRPMLAPFTAMVDAQLHFREHVAEGRHLRRKRTPKPRCLPNELEDRSSIVLVAGEANAWPHPARGIDERPEARRTEELVQWLGYRLGTGERFEQVLRPRQALCPATLRHTRLGEEELARGATPSELQSSWSSFLREGDVLVGWGHYAAQLFAAEGGQLPERFLDLRRLLTRELRAKPGPIDRCAARLASVGAPLGRGRGGERLAQLVALTEALLDGRISPADATAPSRGPEPTPTS